MMVIYRQAEGHAAEVFSSIARTAMLACLDGLNSLMDGYVYWAEPA